MEIKTSPIKKEVKVSVFTPEMMRSKIALKIKEVYATEKGKQFIAHLVRSFLPADRIQFVENPPEQKMECAITNRKVIAVSDAMRIVKSENNEEFLSFMLQKSKEMTDNIDMVEHPFNKILNGRLLAVKCLGSQKFLSEYSWRELKRFVENEVVNNNKHITFLLADEIRKMESKDTVVEKPKSSFQKWNEKYAKKEKIKNNVQQKQKHVNPQPATQSLGDNEVLKRLRETLPAEQETNTKK